MKLIVEPNFFSKFVLILGLYDALGSSGLKSQPFMSYRNCLTPSNRNPLYAVLTTFRKSYIKHRDFNIFKVSLLFLVKERPLYQNLKENWKYL